MSSAICLNLDLSKILPSGYELSLYQKPKLQNRKHYILQPTKYAQSVNDKLSGTKVA